MIELLGVIESQFKEAVLAHSHLLQDSQIARDLADLSLRCADSLSNGGVIFFAGNGGSFADAQHMAAELTGKMGRMRRSLAGIALGTNGSSMSAIGNDFGYENSFARELEGLHRDQSVVVGFSTSGNSPNLVELAKVAERLGAPMTCLTGESGGQIADFCDVIRMPSGRTERVQEMHTLFGHTLCLCIEELMGLSSLPYGD